MRDRFEPSELLSLIQIVYGPPTAESGSHGREIAEEMIRRRLWQLDEGCVAPERRSEKLFEKPRSPIANGF